MADVDGAGKLTDHVGLGALTRVVPRHVVDEVLAKTGRKEKRSRSLPAHVVVYFVLALALFTDGYEEVIRKLVHGLRFARTWDRAWVVPTTGALSQARTRLGAAPLKALFETVAVPVAAAGTPGAWLRSWRVMALDGVMIDVPDTAANLAHYDKPSGGTRRPYPQLRAVGLCEVGTRAVVGAAMGTIRTGERALAATLTGNVGPGMVITADRGFFSFDLWRDYALTGAQLLWRLSATTILEPTEVLADGSYLAEITGKHTRAGRSRINLQAVGGDLALATHIPVRVVEYTVHTDPNDPASSSEVFRLITTILDPAEVTAPELAAAYHERWEQETAFREIEISLRNGAGYAPKPPTSSPKSSTASCSPTTPSDHSWSRPPTPSRWTPTEYRSPEPCTSYAAGSPIPRHFPPSEQRTLRGRRTAQPPTQPHLPTSVQTRKPSYFPHEAIASLRTKVLAHHHDQTPTDRSTKRHCSNYTSAQFHTTLTDLHIRHSVGRTGVCWDNAMAESFFAALKNELVHRTIYPPRTHATRDIAKWIDGRYNSRRLHSGIGYRTPNEAHNAFHNRTSAA